MGINFRLLEQLEALRIFPAGGRILDIGCSNLYTATAAGIEAMIGRFRGPQVAATYRDLAARLERGSAYDPARSGLNEAFAGELLEACGMQYLSFDIAGAYRTQVFDLNTQDLPPEHRNAYDVVLNIGTTEHVLNQYNSFKVIHEAAKPGGVMVHQLPVAGSTDHGYFVYTGRMFFDLAAYNGYEIVELWYDGPSGQDRLMKSVQSYRDHFPVLATAPGRCEVLREALVPNYSVTIIYRKMKDSAFAGCLELSTSVGPIPASVRSAYVRKDHQSPVRSGIRALFRLAKRVSQRAR